jgi:hypothetical protein
MFFVDTGTDCVLRQIWESFKIPSLASRCAYFDWAKLQRSGRQNWYRRDGFSLGFGACTKPRSNPRRQVTWTIHQGGTDDLKWIGSQNSQN